MRKCSYFLIFICLYLYMFMFISLHENVVENKKAFSSIVYLIRVSYIWVGTDQVRCGAYSELARRRVHLATVIIRPPFGHRPGRRQAHHAHIFQTVLRLAIVQADTRRSCPYHSDRSTFDVRKRPSTGSRHPDSDKTESNKRGFP